MSGDDSKSQLLNTILGTFNTQQGQDPNARQQRPRRRFPRAETPEERKEALMASGLSKGDPFDTMVRDGAEGPGGKEGVADSHILDERQRGKEFEVSPLANIVDMYTRQRHALQEEAVEKDAFYTRIKSDRYTPAASLANVMKSAREPGRVELWSFLENQEEPEIIEEPEPGVDEPLSLQDMLSEARAMLGVPEEDGSRRSLGRSARKKLDSKRKQIQSVLAAEEADSMRWSDMVTRGMKDKVYGSEEKYEEVQREKLRAQFDRPDLRNLSQEQSEEAVGEVLKRIEEMDQYEQREKSWREDLKEPALREFLAKHADNELKQQVEKEVEDLYNSLEKSEFDSVFQRERVLNAKLKADAVRLLDPVTSERMPIGSANTIDTRTVLNQFDRNVTPAYQTYTYLSKVFGDALQSESREDIKAALSEMDQEKLPRLHMPRNKGISYTARVLLQPSKMKLVEERDLSNATRTNDTSLLLALLREQQKQQDVKEGEAIVEGIREYVQELIDKRQAALRLVHGIKTGRRGRSPVVVYPYREEEVVLAVNGDFNKEFPDLDSSRISSALDHQMSSVATLDRVDKRLANQRLGFKSYMDKQRRRFRTNRRRVAHNRLTNTLKAFTWLRT